MDEKRHFSFKYMHGNQNINWFFRIRLTGPEVGVHTIFSDTTARNVRQCMHHRTFLYVHTEITPPFIHEGLTVVNRLQALAPSYRFEKTYGPCHHVVSKGSAQGHGQG